MHGIADADHLDILWLGILMFWGDHNPPHFHARYGGEQPLVRIADLRTIEGELPRRGERMSLE